MKVKDGHLADAAQPPSEHGQHGMVPTRWSGMGPEKINACSVEQFAFERLQMKNVLTSKPYNRHSGPHLAGWAPFPPSTLRKC